LRKMCNNPLDMSVHGNKVKPTKLQKATLEILKENPNMPLGKAMVAAGYAENTSRSPKQKLVESKGLSVAIEDYREILRDKGITEHKLAEKQAEWLDAKKVVSALVTGKNADSKTTDFIEVPDYQIQVKAGEMLREDFGLKQSGPPININFNKIATNQKQEYGI